MMTASTTDTVSF